MEEPQYMGMDLAKPGSDRTVVYLARNEGKRMLVLSPEAWGFLGKFSPEGSTFIRPLDFYAPPFPDPPTEIEAPRNRKERRHQAALTRRGS